MTEQQKTEAHAAIDKYVHSYLKSRDLLYLEEDWLSKCHDVFDVYIPLCKGDSRAQTLAFARQVVTAFLQHEYRSFARRKRREKTAFFRFANALGELLDQKRIAALVHEVLSRLPLDQVEILLCFMGQEEKTLHRIAKERGIPWASFHRNEIAAAKTAFIDIYQKLIKKGY